MVVCTRDVRILATLLAALTLPVAHAQQTKPKVDFAHDIAPLLKARCGECHTNGTYKASVSMDTREDLLKSKVVVPGKSAASELIKRVTSADKEERMPPKGEPLSAKEI